MQGPPNFAGNPAYVPAPPAFQPYPVLGEPPASERKKAIVPSVLVLVGVVLLLLTFVFPWAAIDISGTGSNGMSASAQIQWETYQICISLTNLNESQVFNNSSIFSHGLCSPYSSISNERGIAYIFDLGLLLVLVALLLGLVGAALGFSRATSTAPLSKANLNRPASFSRKAAWVALAAGLFYFIITSLVDSVLSGSICKTGFSFSDMGSCTASSTNGGGGGVSNVTLSWAPSIAFYLAIAAFVLMLVGGILLTRYKSSMSKYLQPPSPGYAPASMPPPSSPPANAPWAPGPGPAPSYPPAYPPPPPPPQ